MDATVAGLIPLFRELNDLKRIRVAGRPGSLAERLFLRAWVRLLDGEDLTTVALGETAHAVAAARLAGIDAAVLAAGGLDADARRTVLRRGFDAVAGPLDPALAGLLRAALDPEPFPDRRLSDAPAFAVRLAAQPRAGATRPGRARVLLEPAESHAEHCAVVAVQGVLAAPLTGAEPAAPFLTGLAHHLHNAFLPDAGDAGDALLGENLGPMMERFRAQALTELPERLREMAAASLEAVFAADFPEAQAFQTADVLDRVLEMEWHARSAAFTLDVALGEMDIVHPGPVQAFQREALRAAQVLSSSSYSDLSS